MKYQLSPQLSTFLLASILNLTPSGNITNQSQIAQKTKYYRKLLLSFAIRNDIKLYR